MANEAIPMFAQGSVLGIPFICANATGIEMGTLVKLADPFTVSAASALNDVVGGITLAEKIASNGEITVPVARSGIWKVTASGNVTVGNALIIAAIPTANKVEIAAVNSENVIGIALETATDSETFLMELRPTVMNLA